jgi:hypothetical protein
MAFKEAALLTPVSPQGLHSELFDHIRVQLDNPQMLDLHSGVPAAQNIFQTGFSNVMY